MDFFNFLSLVGGLALFLYGMELMGDSLIAVSGKRLKGLLENLTSNKYKGVLLGAGVTSVIQSSSATTVMVVSLVNSGIMKLSQAIAIIMGANIGTTITAWILSLTGIRSENFFVQMLKPSSFSPILAIVAVGWLLFSKNERLHQIAKIMIGFAILMYGMDLMSASMEPLAEMPQFQQLFVRFSNPLLGVLAGTLLTALIQSSSASVGILQALSATGLVTLSAAIPIIMGQNIGTCITAALASIGAKRNAKRAALSHLLSNLIGTVLFLVVFYTANYFVRFEFMDRLASPVSIAIIHSLFNIVNTAILINFTEGLERLVKRILPVTKEELAEELDIFVSLDERLLDTPSVALEQTKNLSVDMFALAKASVQDTFTLLDSFDYEVYKRVKKDEKKVDKYQDALSSYLIKIVKEEMSSGDNRNLTTMLSCISEFERISDHAMGIASTLHGMDQDRQQFSMQAQAELRVYMRAVNQILDLTYNAYVSRKADDATMVEPLEEVIDVLNDALKIRHIERLRDGRCSVDLGISLTDMTTSMERIADHCSNVAVALIEMPQGAYDPHRYLKKVRKASNTQFQALYESYLSDYELPADDAVPLLVE